MEREKLLPSLGEGIRQVPRLGVAPKVPLTFGYVRNLWRNCLNTKLLGVLYLCRANAIYEENKNRFGRLFFSIKRIGAKLLEQV